MQHLLLPALEFASVSLHSSFWLRRRTPTGTGANRSTQSANGSRAIRRWKKNLLKKRKTEVRCGAFRWSAIDHWSRSRKKDVDTAGLLIEAVTKGSGICGEFFNELLQ